MSPDTPLVSLTPRGHAQTQGRLPLNPMHMNTVAGGQVECPSMLRVGELTLEWTSRTGLARPTTHAWLQVCQGRVQAQQALIRRKAPLDILQQTSTSQAFRSLTSPTLQLERDVLSYRLAFVCPSSQN